MGDGERVLMGGLDEFLHLGQEEEEGTQLEMEVPMGSAAVSRSRRNLIEIEARARETAAKELAGHLRTPQDLEEKVVFAVACVFCVCECVLWNCWNMLPCGVVECLSMYKCICMFVCCDVCMCML